MTLGNLLHPKKSNVPGGLWRGIFWVLTIIAAVSLTNPTDIKPGTPEWLGYMLAYAIFASTPLYVGFIYPELHKHKVKRFKAAIFSYVIVGFLPLMLHLILKK